MLRFILRVLRFSGIYAKQLKLSFILSFLESMLYNTPVLLTVLMFTQAMEHSLEFRHIAYYAGGDIGGPADMLYSQTAICSIRKRYRVSGMRGGKVVGRRTVETAPHGLLWRRHNWKYYICHNFRFAVRGRTWNGCVG